MGTKFDGSLVEERLLLISLVDGDLSLMVKENIVTTSGRRRRFRTLEKHKVPKNRANTAGNSLNQMV